MKHTQEVDMASVMRKVHELMDEHRVSCHGELFNGDADQLRAALDSAAVRFHEGRIRGALPQMR